MSAFVWGVGALELGLLFGMCVLTMAGVEVSFHRQLAHNAFETKPALRTLLAIADSMAAQGGVIYGVATHRRHHVHSDTPEDPHSPHYRKGKGGNERMSRLKGLWHAHMGNMYTGYPTNCTLFGKDIIKDPALARVDRFYRLWIVVGLLIPTLLGGVIAGTWIGAVNGLLWGGLVRIFVVHHIYFANGSFSHMYGGQPYDNGDFSTNNPVFAIPTFGSAYQNNHHAFPSSALLGLRWYQPDVGAWFIRAFEWLGLAWNVKLAPREQIEGRRRRVQHA
jgi:stearoyl-CoA desaturase (delta-9 desaturase)